MGTSKGYGGPSSGLVPSWIDDVAQPAGPAAQPNGPRQPNPSQPGSTPSQSGSSPSGPVNNDGTGSLRGARSSFTRFARTGSPSDLGNALSSYVRKGVGGSSRGARRMGTSRATAAKLLSIFGDVQRNGAAETLRRLQLTVAPGQPASQVLLALLEFICPPGGAIDEGVARQAALNTIAELDEAGSGSFQDMTEADRQNFFLDFVANSIESMIMADLGGRGITMPDDVEAVERIQSQLSSFITGCTRGQLANRLEQWPAPTEQEVNQVTSAIYEAAFDLIATAAEGLE
ncbi:Qat anti-phage system associated protein QatB [Pseudomonas sp. CBZ-4]|uniref:Qat anti-phage system associated protein QatB n=1 Tax=Pseudomonas sp. CBZ-4 TaxID=1163065 RepID=UPI0027351162|nr:Qat anti-phage system associated protein QatB [Pseudomonas sp. CBZ-4]